MADYLCYNPKCATLPHPFRFSADEPVCPKCGIRMGEPRYGHMIGEAKVIHFEAQGKVPGIGVGYPACGGPGTKSRTGIVQGEPSIVTCAKCKESEAFRAATDTGKVDVVKDSDFKVGVDLAAGMHRKVED